MRVDEMQLPPQAATDLFIVGHEGDPQLKIVQDNPSLIQALVRIHTLTIAHEEKPLRFSATATVGNLKLTIPLPEEMREKERLRLIKEKEKLIQQQNQARVQLANVIQQLDQI